MLVSYIKLVKVTHQFSIHTVQTRGGSIEWNVNDDRHDDEVNTMRKHSFLWNFNCGVSLRNAHYIAVVVTSVVITIIEH
jgi:hypothetical protein